MAEVLSALLESGCGFPEFCLDVRSIACAKRHVRSHTSQPFLNTVQYLFLSDKFILLFIEFALMMLDPILTIFDSGLSFLESVGILMMMSGVLMLNKARYEPQ